MTGAIARIGLGSALGPVGAFFGGLPKWAWIALAGAVALAGGLWWHHHVEHKALAAAEKAGEAKAYANIAAQAEKLTAKANALNAQISTKLRSNHDEEAARIVTVTRDVFLRGPGKAACTAVAGVPIASGGPNQTPAKAGTAVDTMPSGERPDLIAMPRAGAVAGAGEHDQLLNDDQAWHTWYTTFAARWAAWQAESAKARQK